MREKVRTSRALSRENGREEEESRGEESVLMHTMPHCEPPGPSMWHINSSVGP